MYEPQLYDSPISLPARRVGKCYITTDTLSGTVPIVGLRQAYMRGVRPVSAKLDAPRIVHRLKDDDYGTWMTDHPEELNQIGEMLVNIRPHGEVLVGGLGLGVLAKTLANSGECNVTVIERSPDVIALCATSGYEVIEDDILSFLKTTTRKFDFILLDTWQGTGEETWWSNVFPARRIIANRWNKTPVVHCWAEDIMLGQVTNAIISGKRHWHYENLPVIMTDTAVADFVGNVGLPHWESKYGKRYVGKPYK